MKTKVTGYWATIVPLALKDLFDAGPPIEGLGLAVANGV